MFKRKQLYRKSEHRHSKREWQLSYPRWKNAERDFIFQPVPNSRCVSVLGECKCKSPSLLNHRLIHLSFLTCQSCFQADFTIIRLGPSVKTKLCMGIAPTTSRTLEVCSTFCATMTVAKLRFAPEANKLYYMGDLHLQLSSTDLRLEFSSGIMLLLIAKEKHILFRLKPTRSNQSS